MAREKENYRSMLSYLADDKKCPLVMSKVEVAKILGISRGKLDDMIIGGEIKMQGGKIPIGSVANYLCG